MMPDGDYVKHKSGGAFSSAEDGLAEGRPLEEVAKDVADAVAGALRKYGDEPVQLVIHSVSTIRESLQSDESSADTDWVEMSSNLDVRLRQMWGHRDGLELALDVCKAAFLDVRDGSNWDDPMLVTVERYVWKVYEARFAESLALDGIYSTADPAYLAEREFEIRPLMQAYIEDMARRIAASGRAKNLKNCRIDPKKPSVMDDLWGGNE